ncbi:potassium transporter TrkA [Polaribacter pacificus]|uniref:Potassium transporter TrkA n=1 Tax=Polaribacter pacificus TaxID=1775173 RepID=A0A917MAV4_9FLAO|nr:potassium channel protein [Polaribacter pacificus]GGG88744.1 potassium transporter TrkA [Polaribacter pacificus]
MKNLFLTKLHKAAILLLIILAIGVSGYMILSGDSFINSLYMTIITMTTVGFSEVHPLTNEEKVFTIFLILTSITVFGYAVSAFTEYIVSGQLFQHLKLKKVQKKIGKLEGHTIVCGYGRNGKQAILKLQNYNQEVVVVERDKEHIAQLDAEGIINVEGDATTDESLLKAGIERASNLITALPSDADNLFVVLTASQLNKNCRIISRASSDTSFGKLKFAGADNVIMPDKLGGAHMASLVVTPDLLEFVDRLAIEGEHIANLEEVAINDLPSMYLGKTILDLDLRRQTGCTVIGIKTPKGDYLINPESTEIMKKDTILIVLGRPEQILKLRKLF